MSCYVRRQHMKVFIHGLEQQQDTPKSARCEDNPHDQRDVNGGDSAASTSAVCNIDSVSMN